MFKQANMNDKALENDSRFVQLIAERRKNYEQVGGILFDTVQQHLITELIQDLSSSDPAIRKEATSLLITLGEQALQSLIERLQRKSSYACEER